MKNKHSRKFLFIRGSIFLLIGFILLYLLIYFNFINKDSNPFKDSNTLSDSLKFKQEYESLNNITNKDKTKTYTTIKVDKDNPIIYKSSKEILKVLNTTGIILFSSSDCPFSRAMINPLIDAAKTQNIKEIYYLDITNIRNELELNSDNEIVIKDGGTNDYLEILNILNDYLPSYDGLNDESIKRVYTPTVVFINNGEIVDFHQGTVESHTNAKELLNDNQYNELKQIYIDGMKKVYNNNVCTNNEGC